MHAEGYTSHSLKSINSPLFIIVLLNADRSLARGISVTPVPLMPGWKMLHSSRLTNGDVQQNAQPQRALRVIITFAFTLNSEFKNLMFPSYSQLQQSSSINVKGLYRRMNGL